MKEQKSKKRRKKQKDKVKFQDAEFIIDFFLKYVLKAAYSYLSQISYTLSLSAFRNETRSQITDKGLRTLVLRPLSYFTSIRISDIIEV